MNNGELHILRIYLDAAAALDGVAYDGVLIARARAMGIASAAVLRVEEAYGEALLHGAKARDLAPDQRLIVEMVDSQAKLDALVATLERSVEIGLVTLGEVRVIGYGGHRHHAAASTP